ncbi:osmotically inducible protein OsmC [Georgenia soli]|uniref:Osmotically inducible protein OsmC n=1 Tax=Georgenia soli TaxID=638953 RepID=A0A2A9F3B8_9MICO|nr:osmotically inducible protein OsmC [Georgenia soli]
MGTPLKSRGSTTWNGDLASGSGATTLDSSGVGRFNVDWKARTTSHDGWRTSPEELLAAAHSACFAMQLSRELTENGTRPTRLDATAEVSFVAGTGITGIHLHITARVPGVSAEGFRRIAESAAMNCPLSRALTAVEVTLSTTLQPSRPVPGPRSIRPSAVARPVFRGTAARQVQSLRGR